MSEARNQAREDRAGEQTIPVPAHPFRPFIGRNVCGNTVVESGKNRNSLSLSSPVTPHEIHFLGTRRHKTGLWVVGDWRSFRREDALVVI